MTRNTLTYLGLQETQRSNRAKEAETSRHNQATELQAKKELAELISNNLRNYKINLDKNTITRIANNQLNERELSKIQETLRHNVVEEDIGYQKAYADLLKAKKVSSFWEALGMYLPTSVLEKWGNTLGVGADQVLSLVFGDTSYDLGSIPKVQYSKGYVGERDVEYDPRTNTWKTNRGNVREGNSYYGQKKKEKNEIPTDFSNSAGPGGKSNENVSNETQKIGSSAPSNQASGQSANNSSKWYDTTNSSGTRTYYSPGARQSKEVGPGIGLAYS